MRLLDKKAISSDFNVQRKMQIDEGTNIARKVDVLRETLVSLENQHKTFIAGMRQDLINQTKALEEQKSAVQGEVKQLEQRRKELLKPLDDEWAKLYDKETILTKRLFLLKDNEDN